MTPKSVTPSLMFSGLRSLSPSTTTAIQINGGVYLSTDLVIEGDSDLRPENIREGVTLFGVTGTYSVAPAPSEGGEGGGN